MQMSRGTVLENQGVAAKLREYAALLSEQGANPFRARAYDRAADVIARLHRPVSEMVASEGREGLDALPGIGPAIAAAVAELANTGRWSQLERLRGDLSPETLFRTLPGVGPQLAHELAANLNLDSLEAVEAAAHDGSLVQAKGWGPRRVAMVRGAIAERLGRPRARIADAAERPGVELILDVDRDTGKGRRPER